MEAEGSNVSASQGELAARTAARGGSSQEPGGGSTAAGLLILDSDIQ
jgi:hypothetical protein